MMALSQALKGLQTVAVRRACRISERDLYACMLQNMTAGVAGHVALAMAHLRCVAQQMKSEPERSAVASPHTDKSSGGSKFFSGVE